MLIFQKRNDRVERWNSAVQSPEPQQRQSARKRVSDVEIFRTMGIGMGTA